MKILLLEKDILKIHGAWKTAQEAADKARAENSPEADRLQEIADQKKEELDKLSESNCIYLCGTTI